MADESSATFSRQSDNVQDNGDVPTTHKPNQNKAGNMTIQGS